MVHVSRDGLADSSLTVPGWAFDLLFPPVSATRGCPPPVIFTEFGKKVLKEKR